ncbi:outer membrane beta-barrel protein [Namhaeicola litoreus]|uniref:Outer membrane beta-barrel protein n=1 Tax=Namhaeicola litoreus TaxID=1052145 RepID=A0ABW3Y2B3_9FLAO
MKNLLTLIIFFLCFQITHAQFIEYGLKGGLNYNSNGSLQDLSGFEDDFKIKSNEETGFHVGVFSEINLPLWLYIRPELLYTHTESTYKEAGKKSRLEMNKFDVPVLLGFKFLGLGRFLIGPSFSYAFDTDLSDTDIFDNVKKIDSDDFSVNGQVGLGLELGNLGADVRWELGLSGTEAIFRGDPAGPNASDISTVRVDTSPQQVIFSVYYKF